jgi:hypothetical protein
MQMQIINGQLQNLQGLLLQQKGLGNKETKISSSLVQILMLRNKVTSGGYIEEEYHAVKRNISFIIFFHYPFGHQNLILPAQQQYSVQPPLPQLMEPSACS